MEGGQASAPPSGLPCDQQQDYSSLHSYWQSWGRLSTGAFACLFVFLWGNRRRVQCVCQVCLSHLRLSAPYANVQGGLGGTAPWETAGPNPAC